MATDPNDDQSVDNETVTETTATSGGNGNVHETRRDVEVDNGKVVKDEETKS